MTIKLALLTSILARATYGNRQLDGIGVYSNQLVKQFEDTKSIALKRLAFKGDLISHSVNPSGYHLTSSGFRTASALSYLAGIDTLGLNRLLNQQDLIHCPDHCVPQTSKVPLITSIMDVIPLSHPQFVKSSLQKFKARAFKHLAKRSTHLITISEFSAQEISRELQVDRDRISVTPLGVHPSFFVRHDPEYALRVKEKYRLNRSYFISIGTLQPRKNIPRLIQAYKLLPKEIKHEYQLLIVGRPREDMSELVAQIEHEQNEGNVRWLNYLPDEELKSLLQSASAMVFPSLYEGFGLPIIEAFASAVPVITSSATSMPEVAQEAALLVDPYSVNSISTAMKELIDNPTQTQRRTEIGLQRAELFTWENTAKKTVEVYSRVLSRA
jgi:glycosyltransferase involved in cell wall biosynthesis